MLRTTRASCVLCTCHWAVLLLAVVIGLTPVSGRADGAAAPAPLPAGWHNTLVREPVLGSEVYVVTAGDPSNPAVVLMHGLGQNGWTDWRPLMETLMEDHFVLTLDFPGFGRSSVPRGRLSPEAFAAVAHWLVKKYELRQIHLMGHSMGGAVALYYAAQYPATLERLTLIDVAGVLHRAAFVKSMADIAPESLDKLPTPLQRKAAKLINFGDKWVTKVNLLPDITALVHESDMAWRALLGNMPNTNAALSLIHTDFSHILDQVRTPTTIIWGSEDPVAPLRSGYLLQGKIAGAQLAVIEGAGHVPIKSHTAQVAELVQSSPASRTIVAAPASGEKDLICRGQTATEYSGSFRHIILDSCLGVALTNVTAERVDLWDSTVEILNLHVDSGGKGPAVSLHNSAVQITNGAVSGATGIEVNGSRLDIAGLLVQGRETAIRIGETSVIVASVSEFHSPHYRGKAHGAVRAHASVGERLRELQSNSEPVFEGDAQAFQWQTNQSAPMSRSGTTMSAP